MPEFPLRRRLVLIAAAAIVLLAVAAGIGQFVLVDQQRAQVSRSALELTRALGIAVDAELRRSMSALQVLATSTSLDGNDREAFQRRAERVMATRPDWRTIILALPSGEIVVDTNGPATSPPRRVAERDSFERVARTLTPRVGYLAPGPRGEYGVPVRVPVVRDGTLRFVLTAVIKPDAILEVVRSQRVPADWVVSVFDARGMRVARSRSHEKFIGTPAAPSLHELMLTGADEGVGITQVLEGDDVHTAYSRLPETGWAVAIGVPTSLVDAGATRWLAVYGGAIALSLALGVLAARIVARQNGESR
jgi:hypothetical protein